MLVSMFTRLQAVLRTDQPDAAPLRRRRGRQRWNFLALAYIAIDSVGASASAGQGSKRVGDDDEPAGAHAASSDTGLGGSDPDGDLERADTEVASGADTVQFITGAPADFGFSLGPVAASATFGASAGGLVSSATPASTAFNAARGSSTPPPPFVNDGVVGGPKEITPVVDFFQGFDGLGNELGFGTAFRDIASMAPEGAGGMIAAGLTFSDSPLAPISAWASLGGVSRNHKFYEGDEFNAEYAIQATGRTDKGLMHGQGAHGVEAGTLVQWGDVANKTAGNEATLIDTSDWDGALVVKGNYYEFNTIVQINIIWNRDVIHAELTAGNALTRHQDAAGAPEGGPAPLSEIDTGGHRQDNYAQIIEYASGGTGALSADELVHDGRALARASEDVRSGVDPASRGDDAGFDRQVFAGGIDKHTAVLQLQAVVEDDTIDFVVADPLAGGAHVLLPFFADVNIGGSKQSNTSLVATKPGELDPYISVQSYMAQLKALEPKTNVEIVDGDYYEFNTIFQINIVDDGDRVQQTDGGRQAGAGTGIIATGGNIQFNAASIVKDDASDYLYVGGRYTQYNLVMQVNALDNSSEIKQTIRFAAENGADESDDASSDGVGGGAYGSQIPSYHAPDQLVHY